MVKARGWFFSVSIELLAVTKRCPALSFHTDKDGHDIIGAGPKFCQIKCRTRKINYVAPKSLPYSYLANESCQQHALQNKQNYIRMINEVTDERDKPAVCHVTNQIKHIPYKNLKMHLNPTLLRPEW